jgi:hypothetical protein
MDACTLPTSHASNSAGGDGLQLHLIVIQNHRHPRIDCSLMLQMRAGDEIASPSRNKAIMQKSLTIKPGSGVYLASCL